ncbi:hypothetical protein RhiirA4_546895 [Rhizophagus irregularis]|uniref:Uncharacterized protein n=1 Tax=Rhizophagus irregularis TaxID=588596 RepID=A0A2I1GZM0_9GLOM|nr:hypothetical protein RhiirA4_546895 [Rhizophagus irregularis]
MKVIRERNKAFNKKISSNNRILINKSKGKTIIVKNSQQDVIDNNTLLKEYSNYFKFQNHNNIWSHKRRLIGVGICSKRKFIKLSWNSYNQGLVQNWPISVFQKQSQMILDNGKAGGTINYVVEILK